MLFAILRMELFAGIALGVTALLHRRRTALHGDRPQTRVALASCTELLEAGSSSTASYGATGLDDGHLYAALTSRGVPFDVLAWDDPSIDWREYPLVVVRTTWDYSASELHASRFLAWLARLTDAGVRVINHPRVLSWNAHKGYLARLALAGVPVIPTAYVSAGSAPEEADLRALARSRGWGDMLLKPAVGGGSRGCFRVQAAVPGALDAGQAWLTAHVMPQEGGSAGAAALLGRQGFRGRMPSPRAAAQAAEKVADAAAAAARFEEPLPPAGGGYPHGVAPVSLVPAGAGTSESVDAHPPPCPSPGPCDMLVQPYIESVSEGELSLIVIDGRPTHAVVKVPAPADYRTQEEHGGVPTLRVEAVSESELALIQRVLRAARECVEREVPPLGYNAGSPAARALALPAPLPSSPNPLTIARLDFLRLTPAIASSLGMALPSPPLLLLELEAIEPCLFLGMAAAGPADALAEVVAREWEAVRGSERRRGAHRHSPSE
jgi:hypothetical protein